MTGGRYDGQEWPGYRGLIDVPEWEAENLIRQGYAEPPDAPELDRGYDVLSVQEADYESKLRRLDSGGEPEEEDPRYVHQPEGEADCDSDFDRDDGDNDFEREEVTPPVKKPRTVDPKADWIKYARSKGDTEADLKTKAALVELYG